MLGSRRRAIRVGVAAGLVIGLWLMWPGGRGDDRAWTLELRASRAEVAPWQSSRLEAVVTPAPPAGWSYVWADDDGAVRGQRDSASFRSGRPGEHAVSVVVRAPGGEERRAELVLRVAPVAYVGSEAAPPPEPARTDLDFGFADIEVEKDSICRGEPTLIRVAAQRDGGDERWLVPSIGGRIGWEVAYSRLAGEPGTYRVPITLLDPQGGEAAYVDASVFVEVKDCVAPWVVLVQARPFTTDEDRGYELAASLRDGPAWEQWGRTAHEPGPDGRPPASPVAHAAAWRWDFGDGTVTTSRTPFVRHEFPGEEARGMDSALDSYLVRATAIDATGQDLGTGVTTVVLVNRTAELKRTANRLQLRAIHAPVAATTAGGDRFLDVTLRNIDAEETARIDDLSLRLITCAEQDGGVRPQAAASVFAERVIEPGSEIHGRMTWPAAREPDVCFVNVAVSGTSEPSGYQVVGYFSLEVGRGRSVQPVTDAARIAALRRASRALGDPRAPITAETIRRLEDQGAIRRGLLGPPAL